MAKGVWVVLQHREGQFPRIAWEAVAAAQKLAAESGGKAEAVLLGAGLENAAAEVARFDLAAVHVADGEALRAYTPGAYIGALAPAIQAAAPAFVVFPHTYQTVDYMARLAQAIGAGLLPEVTGFQSADGDKKRGEEQQHVPIHCLEKIPGIRKEPGHRQGNAQKGDHGELEMQRILEREQREHEAQHDQQLGQAGTALDRVTWARG